MFIARRCIRRPRLFHNLHSCFSRHEINRVDILSIRCLPMSLTPQLHNKIPLEHHRLSSTCKANSNNNNNRQTFTSTSTGAEEQEKLTGSASHKKNSFFEVYSRHGIVFVGTYLGVYCATLTSLFLLIDCGLLGEERANQIVADVINYFDLGDHLDFDVDPDSWKSWILNMNPNLAIAWILTKFTEPMRLATSIAITPSLSRLMNRKISGSKS